MTSEGPRRSEDPAQEAARSDDAPRLWRQWVSALHDVQEVYSQLESEIGSLKQKEQSLEQQLAGQLEGHAPPLKDSEGAQRSVPLQVGSTAPRAAVTSGPGSAFEAVTDSVPRSSEHHLVDATSAGAAADSVPRIDRSRRGVLAFANGRPSVAFGSRYRVFDSGERYLARVPRPPLLCIDEISSVTGVPMVLDKGAECVSLLSLSPEDWFFHSNRQEEMPYVVFQEHVLQTCQWLAAYVGTALRSEAPLFCRNLKGSLTLRRKLPSAGSTLETRSRLSSVSRSAGRVIQIFEVESYSDRQLVADGRISLGFFDRERAELHQEIRDAVPYVPLQEELQSSLSTALPREAPFPDRQLRLLDSIDLWIPDGGPFGLGFIEGSLQVTPQAWFFQAHRMGEPSIPGSLIAEGLLQLLKLAAMGRWGSRIELREAARFRFSRPDVEHSWAFRGQVAPRCRVLSLQAAITSVDEELRSLEADGLVLADGRPFGELEGYGLRLLEDSE